MGWSEEKQAFAEQMGNQLSEFFSSYCLVGYTMDGDRVMLHHHLTSKDYDALQQLMEDTIERDFKLKAVVRVETE